MSLFAVKHLIIVRVISLFFFTVIWSLFILRLLKEWWNMFYTSEKQCLMQLLWHTHARQRTRNRMNHLEINGIRCQQARPQWIHGWGCHGLGVCVFWTDVATWRTSATDGGARLWMGLKVNRRRWRLMRWEPVEILWDGGNVSLWGSRWLREFWGLLREAKEERVAIVDIRTCYLHLNIPSFYQVALSINDFM